MKNAHTHLTTALELLNPAEPPAKGKIKEICLRQKNGDSLFVDQVMVDLPLGMIYAKSTSDEPVWHMVPIDQLVGLEVGYHYDPGIKAWFKDAPTLPDVIAKLVLEQKKAGGK